MANQPNQTMAQKLNAAISAVLSPLRGVLALMAILLALFVVNDVMLMRFGIPLYSKLLKPELFAYVAVGVGAVLFATK